ncbi:MAG TPA: hypothetical protein VF647_02690 [Longimicrobium sp.]
MKAFTTRAPGTASWISSAAESVEADQQAREVRLARVADVDHRLAAHVARAAQRLGGRGVRCGEDEQVGTRGDLARRHRAHAAARVGGRLLGVREVLCRDADLVAGGREALREGGAHVARADDPDLHVVPLSSVS